MIKYLKYLGMANSKDLLNQLAYIVDLLEKINCQYETQTIVIGMDADAYKECFEKYFRKYSPTIDVPKTFNISIGKVDIVFNVNNVSIASQP